MRVARIETLRLDEFPNLLYVEVTTDEGAVGLGETFFGAEAVEAYVHEAVAPYLLGQDPLQIERHARGLVSYVAQTGTGAEQRGASAIDIALWDLLGQASGQPLYQLLGGATRDRVPIYNTCAGYRYVRRRPAQLADTWGLVRYDEQAAVESEPYEDLDAFLHRADELAKSLLAQGIGAMKIWPFDPYAEVSGGTFIAKRDLERALEPFRKIRTAVGNEIEIMIEFHGLWNAATAKELFAAVEEFEPYWLEDPVSADSLPALARLTRGSTAHVAVGETMAGLRVFRELLDREATDVVIADPGWAGGISAARKIAVLADSYGVPVTFHDCTGPVVLTAAAHLALSHANVPLQETVRAFYTGWYRELVDPLPLIENGTIRPPDAPGLGISLLPGLRDRPDVHVRASSVAPPSRPRASPSAREVCPPGTTVCPRSSRRAPA